MGERVRGLLIIGLSILVVPALPAQAPADPASEILSAIQSQRYEQAVKLARSALERSPNNVRILTMEAIALSAMGRDRDALAAYDRALNLAPDYLAAIEGAAQIEYKSGSERAIPLLDRLLKLQPNNSIAHAMRAVMASKRRDCETAVHHFALARAEISSQPAALHAYGVCLIRLQRSAEAVSVFRQLAALHPKDRRGVQALATAQFLTKTYRDTIETLRPLTEGQNPDPEALDLASAAWEALGDTPRAVAALRQAIVLAPTNARFYLDFASLCLVHKSYETGIRMLNAGLARTPNAAPLYIARGVLNVQLAQYDRADADFETAEKLDPRQAFGSLARGLSQVQHSEFDMALATVRQRLKTSQKDEFLYYLLAEILTSQGAQAGSAEYKEAVDAASRAVQLKPDFVLARNVLSRLYLQSGELDKAIEQCRLALRTDPADATALYRLVRAMQRSNREADKRQVPALLKRFNEVRQQLRQREAEEGRYKLVEASPPE